MAYLADAVARRAQHKLEQLVLTNRAFAGGDATTKLARDLADQARGGGG
jgi:hypothetical protein